MKFVIRRLSAVTAVGIALIWGLFHKYWLYIPGILWHISNPVAKNHEVVWTTTSSDNFFPTLDARAALPNVVLIVADDLGFNDISFFGGGLNGGNISTPNIDAIGRNGVAFESAYAAHATCSPARAAILTGKQPTKMGYEFTPTHPMLATLFGKSQRGRLKGKYNSSAARAVDYSAMNLPLSETLIQNALKEYGYRSLMLGKWHLGDNPSTTPQGRGFDESLAIRKIASYLPSSDPRVVNYEGEDVIEKFFLYNSPYAVNKDGIDLFEPNGYMTDYLATEASRAITANKNNPFFLYAAFTAPHSPLQALRSDYDDLWFITDHSARVYAAMVVALDRAVGTITQSLKDNNIYDDTIVIFTSDHGGSNMVMQPDVNRPFRGWKCTFFNGGIRVPMFMQWPRRIPPGTFVDNVVSHMDIFPTVLSAAAGDPMLPRHNRKKDDSDIDGVNLFPYVLQSYAKAQLHSCANTAHCDFKSIQSDFAAQSNFSNLPESPHDILFWRSGSYKALLKAPLKLMLSYVPKKLWLYNIHDDPGESQNLADDSRYEDTLDEMVAALEAENEKQIESLWPSSFSTPFLIDKLYDDTEQNENDEYVYWAN
mmetsp:Transcript_21566/g.31360  ORF Transcript_21566/g.31360 Transcript_21566/m.31360 type:complete len:595 (-) Transcript_21566:163-1947(-)|eukprot:CAMPEP_0185030870 /NCGR_PEP_ID=MMETSP1103-20130426/17987_1 /TAXON_ID=36769 /ORGANISM="Paraphysomonas bandaiensis, Strain Caron Lab Isolate" /LENGTH=594 /DNA_ID=CAMNT_0027566161 /DNA_START=39 /DNA_END=1823 /DNA_ORIENTATION=-